MLVLRRKAGEAIVVNGTITICVLTVKGSQITLGVAAPPEMLIVREELLAPKADTNHTATSPKRSLSGHSRYRSGMKGGLMNTTEKRRSVWEVRDWEDKHPTEEIEASTNTEALNAYIQRHGIDTSTFHLIEATFLRYA